MNKAAIRALLAVGLLNALPLSASGDDISPPAWRGQPNSTLQIWEFGSDENPVQPDVDDNPYGTAEATVYGEFDFPLRDTWWIDDEIAGHQGVWNVGGSMGIEISNDPELRPQKLIRVQITYDGGHAVDPSIPFDPWIDVVASDGAIVTDFQLVAETILDPVFTHAVYDLVLEPNPGHETIWIQPRYCQVYVDEIVIDTICIPEPATLALLGLGACLPLFRGKRRQGLAVVRRKRT